MSKEGARATVLSTTKVRTKLKGDCSWMQLRSESQPQPQDQEEKPWMAEVRARQLNSASQEESPVSSPTKADPSPDNATPQRAPSSGYLIRGVFTKTDSKPASPSTSTPNGLSSTANATAKKPSASYKNIAPHTVRPASESPVQSEAPLSLEEQERRRQAASDILKKSSVRQRSYVLSAAKKFESAEKALDFPSVNTSPSFVATRVEITDDDEIPSVAADLPAAASSPEPTAQTRSETSITTAVEVKTEEPAPPKQEDAAPRPAPSPLEEVPFAHVEPGCTKVDTPLPQLVPGNVVVDVSGDPEAEAEDREGPQEVNTPPPSPVVPSSPVPLVLDPVIFDPVAPVLESPVPVVLDPVVLDPVVLNQVVLDPVVFDPVAPVLESPVPVVLDPVVLDPVVLNQVVLDPVVFDPVAPVLESPVPVVLDSVVLDPVVLDPVAPVLESPVPEVPRAETPVPEPPAPEFLMFTGSLEEAAETHPKAAPSPNQSSAADTLAALSDTLISFGPSSTSLLDARNDDDPPEAAAPVAHSGERGPAPEISDCLVMTDDLVALAKGPEEEVEPAPFSPGRWSQDLLGGPDRFGAEPTEEKEETAPNPESSIEMITTTVTHRVITETSLENSPETQSSHVTTTATVIESSSADPFDPYPIGSTSPNSSPDLLPPLSARPIDSSVDLMTPTAVEQEDSNPGISDGGNAPDALAEDVIPIDTGTTSLSRRTWTRTWDTDVSAVPGEDDHVPAGHVGDPQTLVTFERKSAENDSPWDRWTSPTVYTITTAEEEEEEEEEESPQDTETQTITTVTTVRETHTEPEPIMEQEEEQRESSPGPESKKGFVYVKEYVNTMETSLHNARGDNGSGSEYLTSTSSSYALSSAPAYSRGSPSSSCTYCGEPVGKDSKITIEHLNINCHSACFKCGVCSQPMGDLLYNMFLHGGTVHCESCYNKVLD